MTEYRYCPCTFFLLILPSKKIAGLTPSRIVTMTDIQKYKLMNTTVAIVDDHELVLEGFRSFIEKNGIKQVNGFSKGTDLLRHIAMHQYDIYIIDVELADIDSTELIREIRGVQPDAKIIINTMHEEMWVVNKMTEMQVDGVVYKSGQLEQLLDAIVAVNEGHQHFSQKFRQAQKHLRLQNEIPSQRELQVLQLIASGQSTKEIAITLSIAENTVENHRKNLFRKLQVHNMVELVVRAIANGYISPDEISDTNP